MQLSSNPSCDAFANSVRHISYIILPRAYLIYTVYFDDDPVGQVTLTLKPSERERETRVYGMLMGVLPVRFTRNITPFLRLTKVV